MTTKMVLFGERPGPNTDPHRPLFPHTTTGAAARLISYLGVSREEYLADTVRYNVYRDGDRELGLTDARERVGVLHLRHSEEDPRTPFVFVGKSALRAAPNPAWRTLDFMQSAGNVHLIPHTSGANRFYNVEANRDAVSQFLREIWRRMSIPEWEVQPEGRCPCCEGVGAFNWADPGREPEYEPCELCGGSGSYLGKGR